MNLNNCYYSPAFRYLRKKILDVESMLESSEVITESYEISCFFKKTFMRTSH